MNVMVSVIVPVYNAERYLDRCISSLSRQSLNECEFIFVNDGSTDKSETIIRRHQAEDRRIKLVCQQNQGVSAARNAGIHLATGDYIGFVDADDYVDPDMYCQLYQSAKTFDCDVVVSNFESELDGALIVTKFPFPVQTLMLRDQIRNDVLPMFLKSDVLNGACNKLYLRALIQQHRILFPVGVELGEDGSFNTEFFIAAGSMIYINYTGYHYCEVQGSATRDVRGKNYFGRALEVYRNKPLPLFNELFDRKELQKFKSIRLVHSVLSYTHMYLESSNGLVFHKRIQYVRAMIENQAVQDSLPYFREEMGGNLNRYQRTLIELIHLRSIVGLLLLTGYSRMRSKGTRRKNV